jgi:hypothetical protein
MREAKIAIMLKIAMKDKKFKSRTQNTINHKLQSIQAHKYKNIITKKIEIMKKETKQQTKDRNLKISQQPTANDKGEKIVDKNADGQKV